MEPKHVDVSDDVDGDPECRFEAAFANLPWIQREVFRLHRIEALSYAEIASLMGINERYVELQMSKAMTRLMNQLDGHKLSCWERWL